MLPARGRDSTSIATIANVDLKMPYTPHWLINFLTRKLAWHGFKAFREKVYEGRLILNIVTFSRDVGFGSPCPFGVFVGIGDPHPD